MGLLASIQQSTVKGTVPTTACQLALGDFCCALVCNEETLTASFQEYYAGFLFDEQEPDLTLEIDVIHHPLGKYQVPNSLLLTKVVEGNRFSFGGGLLEGSLHESEKYCKIRVKEALLGGMHIRIW